MLAECVASLFAQILPDGVGPTLAIVENSQRPDCQRLVAELSQSAPPAWEVVYVHEPRLGIPIARNRALDVALDLGADWIAIIDDDETAAPDWLAKMVEATRTHTADVLQGHVEYLYGPDAPDWLPRKTRRTRPSGTQLETAFTNNVWMKADVAKSGLRFDEGMQFTGGSDSDFFYRVAEKGWVLCWVNDAVVSEVVCGDRLSMRWQMQRAMRVAANATASHVKRKGLTSALVRHVPRGSRRFLRGSVVGLAGLVMLPLSRTVGLRTVCRGLCDVWSGIGGVGAFFRMSPKPYVKVDGM